jgi:tRNA (cytidine56-2'-O)-methyltransferase
MITILRIGHRVQRDKRITTHCALVSRAFGADKILVDTIDKKIEETVQNISKRFGGNFEIITGVKTKKIINEWEGIIFHLTMYGEKLDKIIEKIDTNFDKNKDILVIIGAEKVPRYIYDIADFNISVGNQPHSEIAALAIFLDRITKGKWIDKKFNGKLEIIPSNKGKKVNYK